MNANDRWCHCPREKAGHIIAEDMPYPECYRLGCTHDPCSNLDGPATPAPQGDSDAAVRAIVERLRCGLTVGAMEVISIALIDASVREAYALGRAEGVRKEREAETARQRAKNDPQNSSWTNALRGLGSKQP